MDKTKEAIVFVKQELKSMCFNSDNEAIYKTILAALQSKTVDVGEKSDGYHTFNELYEHRHILFLYVLKASGDRAWRSRLHSDGTMINDWFIAGLETQSGQATYHLPVRMWELFKDIREIPSAPEWDGHTSNDVLVRIREESIWNTPPQDTEFSVDNLDWKARHDQMYERVKKLQAAQNTVTKEEAKAAMNVWKDDYRKASQYYGNEEYETIRKCLQAAIGEPTEENQQ